MQSTDTYKVLGRFSFLFSSVFLLNFGACAPAGFKADVGIEVTTRALALDASGGYRATDDSLFLPEQLHEISSLCLMVNVTGEGISAALPADGAITCTDPKTHASFPGIGKISGFLDGANLSASSAAVSVPIGTRTIDLIGFEKSSFPNSQCPSGNIEIKGPNGDAAEMFANGVKVNFNLDSGGPYLFSRKAVTIVPGDNNITLEVLKASYGPWAGKDYGCDGGGSYPQIEYSKAYYLFSSSTGSQAINPAGPLKRYDVLRPTTLQNFEVGKDHCELNIQSQYLSMEDSELAGFLALDPNTCNITVSGAWPTYDSNGTSTSLDYIQVGLNVKKENGNQNFTEFFILGPNQSPGILNVAKVFTASAAGASIVDFKNSRRGDFYSGISAKNFAMAQRYLYVVLENLGSSSANFGLNGESTYDPGNGAPPSFGSLIFDGLNQPTTLSLIFGSATQSVSPCFEVTADTNDSSVGVVNFYEGTLAARGSTNPSSKCYLRYKILPVNGSAWLELNNYDLSSDSLVWPNLHGNGGNSPGASTVALRSWINLRVFEGLSLDPTSVTCSGKMLRNFDTSVPEPNAELLSSDAGVQNLGSECAFDEKNSELVAKVSGLQLPDEPGVNHSSYTKAQLKMTFVSPDGVEAYHFVSNGSYSHSTNDENWWDTANDAVPSMNLLKFLRIDSYDDPNSNNSYTYQSSLDGEQYGSVLMRATIDGVELFKRLRLKIQSQGAQ